LATDSVSGVFSAFRLAVTFLADFLFQFIYYSLDGDDGSVSVNSPATGRLEQIGSSTSIANYRLVTKELYFPHRN
jgi:hypothetical protein